MRVYLGEMYGVDDPVTGDRANATLVEARVDVEQRQTICGFELPNGDVLIRTVRLEDGELAVWLADPSPDRFFQRPN